MWVALGVAITLSLIAGYYVGLAIGQRQVQMRHELRSLIDREVKTWWVSSVPDAPSQVVKEARGNESSTAQSLDDIPSFLDRRPKNEAASTDLRPKSKPKISDRVSNKSNRISGGVHHDPGAGEEHNAGPMGISDSLITFHHYIPRDQIKEWEALGWKVKELGRYHDQFSVLGEWGGKGEPIKPRG